MRRMRGFTLLEVMVALGIVALLAVVMAQAIGLRVDVAARGGERDLVALCARELAARFTVEGEPTQRQGVLFEGGSACHWRLQAGDEVMPGLRQAQLQIYADAEGRRLLDALPQFFAR